ncbi:hypothetical protein [Streptomyces sp. NPDC097610]|uniref:hypothetical protein n=1 Tax=Streptomyces sp. NPDC097610 TaxID=3157227 RepID=UPI003324233E
MSYDVFVCRFVNGDQVPQDKNTVYEVLDPYVTARDPEHHFLQLKAGEDGGTADVYLNSENSILISNFGGVEIMNIISDLLRRLEAVLILPGGTVILNGDADREHLSQDLKDEWSVVVAPTGAEITQAIQAS